MMWFIKSGLLYWSEERGDWGSLERATSYSHQHADMPLAFAPQWVSEQAIEAIQAA